MAGFRYNYKKAMAQPAVLFENRNYNHTHHQPQPPPPAPHSFHAAAPPPVPPRPSETCMPFYSSANRSPHVPLFPHLGHSCPTDLYLTPLDTGDLYEEVRAPGDVGFHHVATASSQPSAPALNEGVLGACGGASQEDLDNISTAPLIPASEGAALWGQSQESLHSMSGSLTMKTSSIHNDYVDMNGSPVVPARCRNQEESAAKSTGQDEQWKPGASLSGGDGSDEHPGQEAGKQAFGPNYSNLMTTSQERCENLYAQLHWTGIDHSKGLSHNSWVHCFTGCGMGTTAFEMFSFILFSMGKDWHYLHCAFLCMLVTVHFYALSVHFRKACNWLCFCLHLTGC